MELNGLPLAHTVMEMNELNGFPPSLTVNEIELNSLLQSMKSMNGTSLHFIGLNVTPYY